MKFRTYLEQITGVDIYPLISLVLFFGFFSLLSYWALKVNKRYISNLKQIPFNEDEQNPSSN